MLAWGDRERQWKELEVKHGDKYQTSTGQSPLPPARQRQPRQAPAAPSFPGAADQMERESVRNVYQAFAQHDGLSDGRLPSIQAVNGWLQEQDIAASKGDARRILSALDPCERAGTIMSFGEFWDWWQWSMGEGAEPAQPKQRIEHYDMGIASQPSKRGVGVAAWGGRRESFGDTRNPFNTNFGATRAENFVGLIKNRDSSYVPYFQRMQQQAVDPAIQAKMPSMPSPVAAPKRQKENYPLGRQQGKMDANAGRGHFVSSVNSGVPNSTGLNFAAHRGGFRL